VSGQAGKTVLRRGHWLAVVRWACANSALPMNIHPQNIVPRAVALAALMLNLLVSQPAKI
jgi:hypothetical protein